MKKLLSITDENSILITVEFLESGERLKVGETSIRRYEIDLIVKNDITVDQLLFAVGVGLKNTLAERYSFDVLKDDTFFVYSDDRHPEAETTLHSDEAVAQAALDISSEKKHLSLLDKRRIKKAIRRKAEIEAEATSVLKKANELRSERSETKDQASEPIDSKNAYIICWNIFEECYSFYCNTIQTTEGVDAVRSPREPVIGIGSIDYNRINMGDLLCDSDTFKICLKRDDGLKTLKEAGFITTTRLVFDPIGWHRSAALFDSSQVTEAFRSQTPLYNISERPLRTLDSEPFHVIPPTDIPQKNKQSILTTVLTPLLMTGAMIGLRLLSGSGTSVASSGLMFGGMGLVSAFVALINVRIRNKEHRQNINEWKTQYQAYVQRIVSEIQKKQFEDVELLQQLYPPVRKEENHSPSANDLITKAITVNGDIFSRSKEHPDYLKIRIGTATEDSELVPSVFEIEGEKKEAIFASIKYRNIRNIPGYDFGIILPTEDGAEKEDGTTGYLIDLPYDISKAYGFLKNAPVLLSLNECRSLGIVFDQKYSFQPFLSNMIFDLCFYHSPDDLQIVMLCNPEQDWQVKQDVVRRYKHLPHFRELLGDLSPFAFCREDASLIFNKLLEIMTGRRKKESDGKYPSIVVIVLEEYEFKSHPISEYLPTYGENKDDGYGISFVFCKRYQEELPKYCEYIIRRSYVSDNESNWFLFPHSQVISYSEDEDHPDENRYSFICDAFPPDHKDMGNQELNDTYYRAYKALSALYYKRIAQGANVPELVELLDILGESQSEEPSKINSDITNFIKKSWGVMNAKDTPLKCAVSSLSVPLGKSSNGVTELDLHEKTDGPHMLVAGTTGSGKTETVLTYLVSLCALYSTEQVNLLLVDMKGAGFVDRIGNKDGQGKGKHLPHVVGTVTNIAGAEAGAGTAYMLKRFLHSMNSEVKRRELLLHKVGVDSVDEYMKLRDNSEDKITMEPLPHLFLVIDEFSELMRFTQENDDVDFRKAVTSLARIGRSLGFHIILISQNIENAITPDIRVNSRARLCLKVATRDASKEMIGTDLAASPLMPGNGRAYLLIGTGSKFEYFQSGYSGADITRHVEAPIVITNAELGGKYTLFFDSENKGNVLESIKESEENHSETTTVLTDHAGKKHEKVGKTQLELVSDCINACFDECNFGIPHCVFQQPLPNACYFQYNWDNGDGDCVVLEDFAGRKE